MSLSFYLVLVPTLCYAFASFAYLASGNWPLSVVYAGYAFANVGLLALEAVK